MTIPEEVMTPIKGFISKNYKVMSVFIGIALFIFVLCCII